MLVFSYRVLERFKPLVLNLEGKLNSCTNFALVLILNVPNREACTSCGGPSSYRPRPRLMSPAGVALSCAVNCGLVPVKPQKPSKRERERERERPKHASKRNKRKSSSSKEGGKRHGLFPFKRILCLSPPLFIRSSFISDSCHPSLHSSSSSSSSSSFFTFSGRTCLSDQELEPGEEGDLGQPTNQPTNQTSSSFAVIFVFIASLCWAASVQDSVL